MDLYKTLKIKRSATPEQIKKAFRKRSMISHPDRGGDQRDFEQIVLAYKILGDPQKKARYDTTGEYDVGVNKIFSEAMELIYSVFGNLIGEVIKHSASIKDQDMVQHLKNCIAANLDNLSKEMLGLHQGKKILEDALDRFTPIEGEDNLLDPMVRNHLMGLERTMKQNEHIQEINKEALRIIKMYKFKVDKKKQEYIFGGMMLQWKLV